MKCEQQENINENSRTSVARSPMARLPRLIRTVLSPYGFPSKAPENKYFRNFSYFILKLYVVCTH